MSLPKYEDADAALSAPWEAPDAPPVGWAQWKGTDLCMDLRCACGELSHVDGSFVYTLMCRGCKRVYLLDQHIRLVEIDPASAAEPGHCETKVSNFGNIGDPRDEEDS